MPYRVDLVIPGPSETEWIFPTYADAAKFLKSMNFVRLKPKNIDDIWYKPFAIKYGRTRVPVVCEIVKVNT